MSKLTKSRQQDVVAKFVEEKNLEYCMYIYLDEFLDIHRREHPQILNTYGTTGIKALLEASYAMIRDRLRTNGLLNSTDATNYMLNGR
jgi:hypothetical protein